MNRIRAVRRVSFLTASLLAVVVAIGHAHDLFLKPTEFHVAENADVVVPVLNGTFSESENSIARARVRDIAVVGTSGRYRVDTTAWSDAGDTSRIRLRTGTSGTYAIGASTTPSVIALEAKDFNEYLATDGVPDVLAARRKARALQKPAKERYHKHVKTLIQVGETRTDSFSATLGYPAELIPMANPYAMKPGSVLRLRVEVDGQPTRGQYVLYGGRLPNGKRIVQRSARSDSLGVVRIPLRVAGVWYVKFINMTPVSGDSVDYESKWASLTFEVR